MNAAYGCRNGWAAMYCNIWGISTLSLSPRDGFIIVLDRAVQDFAGSGTAENANKNRGGIDEWHDCVLAWSVAAMMRS